jgi:hypothetical protein
MRVVSARIALMMVAILMLRSVISLSKMLLPYVSMDTTAFTTWV